MAFMRPIGQTNPNTDPNPWKNNIVTGTANGVPTLSGVMPLINIAGTVGPGQVTQQQMVDLFPTGYNSTNSWGNTTAPTYQNPTSYAPSGYTPPAGNYTPSGYTPPSPTVDWSTQLKDLNDLWDQRFTNLTTLFGNFGGNNTTTGSGSGSGGTQGVGELYDRVNWGNDQSSTRGMRYFDPTTGNYKGMGNLYSADQASL